MHPSFAKVGDKFTFQWQPSYRGSLRDGETVLVKAIGEAGILVCFYRNRQTTVRPGHHSQFRMSKKKKVNIYPG